MKYVGYMLGYFSTVLAIVMSIGYIATIVLFGYHWSRGRDLEYSESLIVFSLATYLSYRNVPMFFGALNILMEFLVICKRADEVLQMKEHSNRDEYQDLDPSYAIKFDNVTATWGFSVQRDIYSGKTDFVDEPIHNLVNISFEAKSKDYIAIVGHVGSGKTTMLSAIMKELDIVEGTAQVKGSISYVEQEPFIMSQTIQENILFGLPYDENKLNKAIKSCCLDTDLKQFDHGIQTKIGERGIGISGGQKARISLARAVYADSDIYCLDDPLSALDPHVATEIYNKCIRGVLRSK